MRQQGTIFLGKTVIKIDFPDPANEVIPGVQWGSVDAFPSPAYWLYQVLARRVEGNQINYKLGRDLKEEVAACLLGGYGIPTAVGLTAYKRIKELGAFNRKQPPSESEFFAWLSEPLDVNGRSIRYRFSRQKSKYLAAALTKLNSESPPTDSGKSLRNWLITIPGIGFKTASWIARNWMDADDVAILDVHIQRAGLLAGFFKSNLTVNKNYIEMEEIFIRFSKSLGVRTSELDAVIWLEMMSSPSTVHRILKEEDSQKSLVKNQKLDGYSKKSHSNSNQIALFV